LPAKAGNPGRRVDGAGLTTLVETTASEIYARSETLVPWCEGE
jgi:hypothetical protein